MNETFNFSLTDTNKLMEFYEEMVNEKLLEASNLRNTIPGDVLDAYKLINKTTSNGDLNTGSDLKNLEELKTKIGKLKQKDLYDLARELNVPKRSTLKKPLLLAAVSKAIDDKIVEVSKEKEKSDNINTYGSFSGIPDFVSSSLKKVNLKLENPNNTNIEAYKELDVKLKNISDILFHSKNLNKDIYEIPLLISRIERDIDDINKKIESKESQFSLDMDTYDAMKLRSDLHGLKASKNAYEINLETFKDKYKKSLEIASSLDSPKEYRDELIERFEEVRNLCSGLTEELDIDINHIDKCIDIVNDSFALAVNKENKVESILDKIGYSVPGKETKIQTQTIVKTDVEPVLGEKPEEPVQTQTVEKSSTTLDKLKSIGDGILYESMDPKPLCAKEIKLTFEDGTVHDVIAFNMLNNTHYNKYIFDYVDLSNSKVSSAMLSYNDKNEVCAVFINHNFIHNVSKLTEDIPEEDKSIMINRLTDMKLYKEDPNRFKDENSYDNEKGLQNPTEPISEVVEPDFSSILIPPTEDEGVKEEEPTVITEDEPMVTELTESESPFVNQSAATIYGGKVEEPTSVATEIEPPKPVDDEPAKIEAHVSQFASGNKKTIEEARKTKGYIQPTFRGTMTGEESGMTIPQPVYTGQDQQEFLEEMGYMKPLMSKEDIKISNEPVQENKTGEALTKLNAKVKRVVEKNEKSAIDFLKDKARALKAALTRRNAVSYGTMVNENLKSTLEGKGQR